MTVGVGQLAADVAEAGGEAWHAIQEHLWFRRRVWRVLQCRLCGQAFKTHRELARHHLRAACLVNRPRVSFEHTAESEESPESARWGSRRRACRGVTSATS